MSSDILPCIGFYKIEDLPKFNLISKKLKEIGDYAKSVNMRLSFHPTHFCIPASENPVVVKNAIDEYMTNKKLGKQLTQEGGDISGLYMDDGYLFFRVDPVEVAVYQDTIDFEIRIIEGPQATIKNIRICFIIIMYKLNWI